MGWTESISIEVFHLVAVGTEEMAGVGRSLVSPYRLFAQQLRK